MHLTWVTLTVKCYVSDDNLVTRRVDGKSLGIIEIRLRNPVPYGEYMLERVYSMFWNNHSTKTTWFVQLAYEQNAACDSHG
jgi:hypothetical protein